MKKKIIFLNIFLYLVFFIMLGRVYYLQIIKNDYYLEKLKNLDNKEVYGDTMPRGKIYDCNNNLLVDNKLVNTIYYKKIKGITTRQEIELAYLVKDYIDLDYSKLTISYLKDFYLLNNDNKITKRLTKTEFNNHKKRLISDIEYYQLKKSKITSEDLSIYQEEDKKAIYLYYLMTNGYSYDDKIIKKDASYEEFAYFSENNSNLSGFDTKYTYERLYLYGDTLKNIIGSVGNITNENKNYYLNKGYELDDIVGISNLEYLYDDYLKGEKEVYKVSNSSKTLIKDGKCGNDLYLTIDINLQQLVDNTLEEEIKLAKNSFNTKYFNRSYVTISNPNDGSILAISGKKYQDNTIYDYAIGNVTDTMASGSVVKGASMLVGYNEEIIKIGEYMQDECIKIKATPKKCSIYTMGYLNDLDALKKSSNVYQFKIALKLGGVNYQYNQPAYINNNAFAIYRSYFEKFGLGVKTGIDLEKESSGYKGKEENAGLLMNLAIGQYDTYTNVQLNQYIATIANEKNRYQLHLLKTIKQKDKIIKEFKATSLNEIDILEKYIKRVKLGLNLVIKEGTGYNYLNTIKNASGKTGTSETFVDNNNDGYYETETISTAFVAYFPTDNPQVAIAISTPNISYVNKASSYIYPFNKNVIRKITDKM